MSRGYFGIGIENVKTGANVGTLWRSAFALGASFVFTIGNRYRHQCSDTTKSYKHIPLFHYDSFDMFSHSIPKGSSLVGVELDDRARQLETYSHPESAVYLLGAEDKGLSQDALDRCDNIVQISSKYCLNVATSGSIVMYDRMAKV